MAITIMSIEADVRCTGTALRHGYYVHEVKHRGKEVKRRTQTVGQRKGGGGGERARENERKRMRAGERGKAGEEKGDAHRVTRVKICFRDTLQLCTPHPVPSKSRRFVLFLFLPLPPQPSHKIPCLSGIG